MNDLLTWARQQPGRCDRGFDIKTQHPDLCDCLGDSEWLIFTTALQRAARGGEVHQGDVRPMIRGKVAPKRIGQFYRRARAEGLIEDTGRREQSNDFAGRNTDKLDRIYAWRGQTAA